MINWLPMRDWEDFQIMEPAWASRMKAVSHEEPEHLIRTLSDAILGVGGWIISRSSDDTGMVNLEFEFERTACLDIYGLLVAADLELGASEHMWLNDLCRCTQDRIDDCGREIVGIELEIKVSCQPVKPYPTSPMA